MPYIYFIKVIKPFPFYMMTLLNYLCIYRQGLEENMDKYKSLLINRFVSDLFTW